MNGIVTNLIWNKSLFVRHSECEIPGEDGALACLPVPPACVARVRHHASAMPIAMPTASEVRRHNTYHTHYHPATRDSAHVSAASGAGTRRCGRPITGRNACWSPPGAPFGEWAGLGEGGPLSCHGRIIIAAPKSLPRGERPFKNAPHSGTHGDLGNLGTRPTWQLPRCLAYTCFRCNPI